MDNCIFCKIVKSEIPTYKVYEDEKVLAFLDHRPVRVGHTMIIPKIHVDHFIDLEDSLCEHIILVGKRIAVKIREVLSPPRVGFLVAGFGVSHAHFHVQPLWEEHDITSARYLDVSKQPPEFDALMIDVASHQEQSDICQKIYINKI